MAKEALAPLAGWRCSLMMASTVNQDKTRKQERYAKLERSRKTQYRKYNQEHGMFLSQLDSSQGFLRLREDGEAALRRQLGI